MEIEKLRNEKLKRYRVLFVDRKTGKEEVASYIVSLFPSEVINRQIEKSTVKTVVLFKEVKN